MLQYHLVLVTKYRKPVLFGPIKDLVYQTIQTICDEKGLVLLEMNGEADHIPIFKQYGDTLLKPYYWKPLFWSDSYFVTSVSENSLTNIKTYIQNQ